MNVSQLMHVLLDWVEDGYGDAEVYFNDQRVNSYSTRIVNPDMTGTFEPYMEFVLSDSEDVCGEPD